MREDLWSNERVAMMLKLSEEGLSASAIAWRLGEGLTRNAVIGKLHRIQRAARHVPVPRAKSSSQNRPQRVRPSKPSLPKVALPLPKPVMIETPRGERRGIQVVDLEPHHCRWPIGDPKADDFHFCGVNKGEHRAYCEFHAAMNRAPKPTKGKFTDWTPQQKRDRRKLILTGVV